MCPPDRQIYNKSKGKSEHESSTLRHRAGFFRLKALERVDIKVHKLKIYCNFVVAYFKTKGMICKDIAFFLISAKHINLYKYWPYYINGF
jgi:hypothetical protein